LQLPGSITAGVGVLACGVAGGALGSAAGSAASDYFTNYIFGE